MTENVPAPDPQTDYTPPVLDGISLVSQEEVIEIVDPVDGGQSEEVVTPPDPIFTLNKEISAEAGEKLQIYYDASDIGSGINYLSIGFRDEVSGQSFSGYDYDRDGIITIHLSDSFFAGDYYLTDVNIYDDNQHQNHSSYNRQGIVSTRTRDLTNNQWQYSTENVEFGFKDLKVTVTGGQAPQTDFTAPEITSASFSEGVSLNEITQAAGEKLQIYYDASDIGSGIKYLSIGFRDEVSGQSFSGSDYDRDGIITIHLSDSLVSGDYSVTDLNIYDDNYRQNHTSYNSNGIKSKRTWSEENKTWEYFRSISDLSISDLKVTVSPKISAPSVQSDFIAPVLEGLTLDQTTVEAGDKLYLSYEVSDFAQKKDADGNNVFGDLSLVDAAGVYTGAEFSAIAGKRSDSPTSNAYTDEAPIFWLTDATGNIIFEDTQRLEYLQINGHNVYGIYDADVGLYGNYSGTVYSREDYSYENARTNIHSDGYGTGGYLRDERGEHLQWLKDRNTGEYVLDSNNNRETFYLLRDETKPLFGIPENFTENGHYNSSTKYTGMIAVEADGVTPLTDTDGNPIYWATDSNGAIVNGSDGNPLVVLPLYEAKLAFPIMTNEQDSGLSSVSAYFRNEAGNQIYGSDGDQDGIITFDVSSSQPNGTYQLVEFRAHDRAYNNNQFQMKAFFGDDSGGQFQFSHRSVNDHNYYGAHDFDFTPFTVEVVASTDDTSNQVQTDITAPIISNVSFEPNSLPFITTGTEEKDIIYGSLFDDILNGLAGDDTIDAGAGDDHIKAGIGNDTLTGGEGADLFEFTVGFGSDVITDFEFGVDKISILDENGAQLTLAEYSDLGFSNIDGGGIKITCLLYTSPSPRD